MKKLILALFLLMFFTVPAFTATFYISPKGTANWPNCTSSNPCPVKQLEANDSKLSGADEVIFKNGIYTDANGDGKIVNFTNLDGNGSYIIIRAENEHGAVFDGEQECYTIGFNAANSYEFGYVEIKGFEFRNMNIGINMNDVCTGSKDGHHHVKITNCVFHGIYDWGEYTKQCCPSNSCSIGIRTGNCAESITIDRSEFYDFGRQPSTPYWVHDYAHDVQLYLGGRYIKVTNSTFRDHIAGRAIKLDHHDESCEGSCWTHRIYNNTFHGDDNPQVSGNILFYNNETPNQNKRPHNVYIGNNLFHQPANNNDYGDDLAIWVGLINGKECKSGHIDLSSTIIENNITNSKELIGPCTENDIIRAGGKVYENQKLNNRSISLGMENPEKHNFSLNPDASGFSFVHDTGSTRYTNFEDYLGNSRPYGKDPDIGAFEYGSQPEGVGPLPSAPKGLKIVK